MMAIRAPRWVRLVIGACIPADDRDAILADLDEVFMVRSQQGGSLSAQLWYARQAGNFVLHVGIARLAGRPGRDAIAADLRSSARTIRRHPLYAATFVTTLAAAIGVVAAVTLAARWVALRPIPGVRNGDELATLRLSMPSAPDFVAFDVSVPHVSGLRARLPVDGRLAGVKAVDVDLASPSGEPFRSRGELVSGNYFDVLGATVAAGRLLTNADESPSSSPSAVVTPRVAELVAGSVERAVGSTIRVNGAPVLVVGVTRPGFRGAELPGKAEIWFTVAALTIVDPSAPSTAATDGGYGAFRNLLGRRPEGMTVEKLAADANLAMQAMRGDGATAASAPNQFTFRAWPGAGLDPGVRATARRALMTLTAAAALLLALAAANLTNLAVARAAALATPRAIRLSLGASRFRLMQTTVIEAGVLGLAGGIGGLALASLCATWFADMQLAERGGALLGASVDGATVAVALSSGVAVAVVSYLLAQLTVGSRNLAATARAGRASRQRVGRALLVVQVALSVVLLVGAGLLGRTVRNFRAVDLGFDPAGVFTIAFEPHLHAYESASLGLLARRIEDELAAVAGARGAGVISPAPFVSGYFTASMYADASSATPVVGAGFFVSPGALRALGGRFVAGNANWRGDSATAVLSRSAAHRIYPGVPLSEVVGRFMPTRREGGRPVRIDGIVEDIRLADLTRPSPPVIFRPLAERRAGMSVVALVATTGDAERLAPVVRHAIARVAPEVPVFDARSARRAIDRQFAERDAMSRVSSVLGVVGLLLAGIGVYGVLASAVASRRREMSIRAALGASPSLLAASVLEWGLGPIALGVCFGLGGAVFAARALASQLYQLDKFDPPTFATGALIMALAGLAACIPSALRAAAAAPAEVMRDS
jgi:putative ABC transport system permease protein